MIALVLFIIFGLTFAYFATENTIPTAITLGGFQIIQIPVYVLVLVTFAFGLLTGGLFGVLRYLFYGRARKHDKDELHKSKQEVVTLTKQIHKLELENTRLRTKLGEENADDDSL